MSVWFWFSCMLFVVLFFVFIGMAFDEEFPGAGLCAFLILISSISALFYGGARCFAFDEIDYNYKSVEIESLTLNSNIYGEGHWAFTVGYAYIDELPYYYFYEKKDGGLGLNSISAVHSILIETDECTPHIEIPYLRTFKKPNPLAKFWRTDKRLEELKNGIDYFEMYRKDNGTINWTKVKVNECDPIKIYVPTGTVTRQYNANTGNL